MNHDGTQLDDTDRQILALLHQNARRTFGDIGANVNLSAPAVKRRVDRMEAQGVIKGYTTVVDHAKLGAHLEAFAELRISGDAPVDAIERIADDVPEIQALFTIAGDPDALAWLRVRDVHHLKEVIDRLRQTAQVTGTKTLMVLGSVLRADR